MPNMPKAVYTETFYEFLKNNPTFLAETIVLSDESKSKKLIDMLIHTFNIYEIGNETEDLFKLNFTDVFNMHKDYYEEKLAAYEKEYDYSVNNKKRVVHNKTIDIGAKKSSRIGDNTKRTDIDLPNKQVGRYEEYPSFITKDENLKSVDDKVDSKTNIDDENITYYDDEFIDLKNKYIKQITNVYLEFANKFKECFLMIY